MGKLVLIVLWGIFAGWLAMGVSPDIAIEFNVYNSDAYPLVVVVAWAVFFFGPFYIKRITPDLNVEPEKKSWY